MEIKVIKKMEKKDKSLQNIYERANILPRPFTKRIVGMLSINDKYVMSLKYDLDTLEVKEIENPYLDKLVSVIFIKLFKTSTIKKGFAPKCISDDVVEELENFYGTSRFSLITNGTDISSIVKYIRDETECELSDEKIIEKIKEVELSDSLQSRFIKYFNQENFSLKQKNITTYDLEAIMGVLRMIKSRMDLESPKIKQKTEV